MSNRRSHRAIAATGAILLAAVVTTGCGRRGLPVDSVSVATSPGPALVAASAALETISPNPTPNPTRDPTPTISPAASDTPVAAPLATPDLTAIESLLADLDAALGADATADTDEGSAN